MFKFEWLVFTALSLVLLQTPDFLKSNASVHTSSLTPHTSHPVFPYDLDNPDATFDLSERMKEVSGLSLSGDGSQLAAIDDEKGVIFLLDKNTGEIKQEINFWEDGDYEGLEIVGNDAYAVKSTGTIYQVKNYLSENRETIKLKSFLNKDNDVEGLAYDPTRHCLLLGCKGKGVDGEGTALKKAIYAFDLNTMEMDAKPAYLLTLEDVQGWLDQCNSEAHLQKLQEYFTPGTPELKFSPSGIAVHPITGDVYVTSSSGKMLLTLNRDGKIVNFEKLKKSVHPQPEGLCFDTDGTLFISNEGKEGPAKIYKFRYRN